MILVKHVIGKMNLRLEIGEISLGKDIQKRELYTFSGNVSRYNHYRKQCRGSSEN